MGTIRILITGGAGFIGSHLIERFLKDGHEAICLDNFDTYYDPEIKRSNVAAFLPHENFKLIEGDIRDKELMKRSMDGADYVFHEAAQAGVRASVENPFKSHDVNATGTLNVLEAALESDVKKIIYASSSSVYGKVDYLPFDEDHPNHSVSPYGVSKFMAEEYCRVFSEVYGLKTISLRYFTVYGPRMRPDLAINIFTRSALQDEPLKIFGTGEKTRDFTYIDDIVEANVLAMRAGSGAYNIGSGQRIGIQELAEMIIRITGSRSEILHGIDARGDAQHTWADTRKARKELGWMPGTGIEEGIARYIEWFKSQPALMKILARGTR